MEFEKFVAETGEKAEVDDRRFLFLDGRLPSHLFSNSDFGRGI
jgi:hypothetical protein